MAFKQLISVLILAAVAMAQSRPTDPLSKLQSEVEELKARLNAMKGLEERVALLEQELLEVRLQSKIKPAGPTTPTAPVSAKNGTPGLTPPAAGAAEVVKAAVEPVEPVEAVVQAVKRPVIEEEAPFDAVKLRAAEAEAEAAAKAAEAAASPAPAAAPVVAPEPTPVAALPAPEPVPATVPVVAPPLAPDPDPIKGVPGRSETLTSAQPVARVADPGFKEKLRGYGLTVHDAPELTWNFEKFLVNRKGEVVARFAPDTLPTDEAVIKAIEHELPPLHA